MSYGDAGARLTLASLAAAAVLVFGGAEIWADQWLRCLIFGLFCWICALAWWRRQPLIIPPLALPPLLLFVWSWCQIAFLPSPNLGDAFRGAWRWGVWAALICLSAHLIATREARHRWIRLAVAAAAGYALVAVTAHYAAPGRWFGWREVAGGRPLGSFVNPDHYAVFVELVLPMAIWLHTRRPGNWWPLLAVGVLYGSVFVSASRAGAVLATIELLCLPGWFARRHATGSPPFSRYARRGWLLLAAAAGVLVCDWQLLWRRLQEPEVWKYRSEIYSAALHLYAERPWMGAGPGSYETMYPSRALFDTAFRIDHAHSDWLEWAVEGGFPAIVFLGWFVWRSFVLVFRHAPWAVGAVASLVHASVDFPLQLPGIYVPLLCVLGAAEGSLRLEDGCRLGRVRARTSYRGPVREPVPAELSAVAADAPSASGS